MPSLSARTDKEALIRKCIAGEIAIGRAVSIEGQAMVRLTSYDWPGNIYWVMTRVAAQLGISRNTLYRKIKRHCIPLSRD